MSAVAKLFHSITDRTSFPVSPDGAEIEYRLPPGKKLHFHSTAYGSRHTVVLINAQTNHLERLRFQMAGSADLDCVWWVWGNLETTSGPNMDLCFYCDAEGLANPYLILAIPSPRSLDFAAFAHRAHTAPCAVHAVDNSSGFLHGAHHAKEAKKRLSSLQR